MQENFEPVDPIFRLAEQHSVILLNGGGFDAPEWSVRISLANSPTDSYQQIGTWLRTVGDGCKAQYDGRRPVS